MAVNGNVIFIETGQCGNQLGYSLYDTLYSHLVRFIDRRKGHDDFEADSCTDALDMFFRSSSRREQRFARAVCLDTEPKVIHDCMRKSGRWRINPKSVAFRHGGAGNNWALGYEMASGEFLETSLDMISREMEHCDYGGALVFTHSVAGGTGSGLGTRISEACMDHFASSTRMNIAIAPYHFGEVVVQNYNALLCLSKVSAASHAVLVFENEVAQALCRDMHGIERPTLSQLNDTIVSNLCPLFLPRFYASSTHSSRPIQSHLVDDMMDLCGHPGFKFIDVKLTPQTSRKSVAYTHDSWPTLLRTVQQLQLSGASSERDILHCLKHALSFEEDTMTIRNFVATFNEGRRMRDAQHHLVAASGAGAPTEGVVVKTLASKLIMHGPESADVARTVQFRHEEFAGLHAPEVPHYSGNSLSGKQVVDKATVSPPIQQRTAAGDARVHSAYYTSHFSPMFPVDHYAASTPPVRLQYSPIALNGYQRAASIVSNSQAILPLLRRATAGAANLYEAGAYLHQYSNYGIESEDFISAFRSIGSVIQNYSDL